MLICSTKTGNGTPERITRYRTLQGPVRAHMFHYRHLLDIELIVRFGGLLLVGPDAVQHLNHGGLSDASTTLQDF